MWRYAHHASRGLGRRLGASIRPPSGGRSRLARPIIVLFHNRFFEDWPELPELPEPGCRFTTDPAAFQEADAVVFHLPTLGSIAKLRKRRGQIWVAWSMESRAMCPLLDDAGFMARIDLTMTYERTSDVWCPYFGLGTVAGLQRPVTPRTAGAPVVYLQSNAHDRCGRFAYAGELMKHVGIDSFGPVHRNQARVIPPGHLPRVELYSRYKFTLAFENSVAPDYVTEKLYEPLTVGSVPVYRGTRDVAELAPDPGSYIDARRFGSATELGRYLAHLDEHDDEYLAYHDWRSRPWSPSFRHHLAQLHDPPFVRLAALVATRLGRVGSAVG